MPRPRTSPLTIAVRPAMLAAPMARKREKTPQTAADGTRLVTENKKARHEFLILEELEAGIVLSGTEVKSLRAGHCSLAEAFCLIKSG